MDQLARWAESAHPPLVYWLSGFSFPTGFLTAVLQTAARSTGVSVDLLSWEFTVLTIGDQDITGPPKVRVPLEYDSSSESWDTSKGSFKVAMLFGLTW